MKYIYKLLIILIAFVLITSLTFSYPLQVVAITLPEIEIPINTENYSQDAQPYKVGNIIGEEKDNRDEHSKQFILDDGTLMAVSYAMPIHYEDENGNWVDYDNSLEEIASTATEDELSTTEYTNKSSDIKVNYSNKSKENNMIKIKTDDYQVSWGYPNTNKVTAQVVTNNEELEGNEKYTTLSNLTSEVIYENAYNNVDIQYITSSVGIKENIILKNEDAQSEFTIQYKINSLTAVAVNDKLIELRDESNNPVYLVEAPYMIDANGEKSTQLSLSIIEQKNSKLTIQLTTDETFLSTATYPVTVDPSFLIGKTWNTAECSYVDTQNPNTSFGLNSETGHAEDVYVGNYGQGLYRTYYRLKELPQLNKGDMVVQAKIYLALLNDDFYDDFNISAYYVTESWDQDTLTWNNQPSHFSGVTDYVIFDENSEKNWYTWDITDCMKQWYNGYENYGIMFMTPDEDNAVQCATIASALDANHPNARPLFEIVYRNNKGLEGRWTYSSFAVGTAGTAYINDYSGNLVFLTSEISTASGYAPASIRHVFNGYMANQQFAYATPKSGFGWQLNINQTLRETDESLLGERQADYPYVYTDEDGTDHYFYKKTENGTTKYVDEDGLGLELTIDNSSIWSRYTITNDKGIKHNFIYTGRLHSIVDSNGNETFVHYTGADTVISTEDGTGTKLTVNSTTINNTKYLSSIVDAANRTTSYTYDSSGYLTKITNPNGTNVTFTYDSEGSLKTVTDVDGYKVQFNYTSSSSGKKVNEIIEYGTSGTAGQKITFTRNKYNTTVIKTYGADGIGGTADDLTSTYQFDEWGRTISVKSNTTNRDLGASVYTYTDGVKNSSASNIKQLNRVTSSYTTGSIPINFIQNSNMENTSAWEPSAWCGTNTFTSGYTTDARYFGNKSLYINVTDYHNQDSRGRVSQDIDNSILIPGNTYTLSGYIKTSGVVNSTASINSGAFICADSVNSDGTYTTFHSDYVEGNTSTAIDNGWQRVSVTFTVPENSEKTRINLALRTSTGTAYFDGVQVESYPVPNGYNFLQNSGFEEGSTGWVAEYPNLDTSTDRITNESTYSGSKAFGIEGTSEYAKGIKQTVYVSGSENDTYIVSGWAKADAVPSAEDTRKFKISVKITYTDGTSAWQRTANFNHSITDWQFTSAAFTLSDGDSTTNKTPYSITVCLRYHLQANYAYFDNICLEKDNAQSYTYDEEGNLVTVVDHSKEQSSMEYEDSNLIKSVDAKGYAYEYDYDDNHNMTKATSQNGVNYNYTYNSNGLPTTLEVKGTNVNSLKSEVTYNEKGQLATATDQDKQEIRYDYDQYNNTLTSVHNPSGTTNYTYDSNTDQMLTASKADVDEGKTYDVAYEYSANGKYLTKINHNNTDYILEYDQYGNETNSKVGTQSLKEDTYNSNNGAFTSSTYGTGQTVSCTYDAYGNTSTKKYNGVTAFSWNADRNGNVTREYDYINDLRYDYVFDTTGRLVRQNAKHDTDSGTGNKAWYNLEYGYDLNNNVTRFGIKTPYRDNINLYEYGKDNLLTKFHINDLRTVNYTYDGLNRLTATSLNTTSPINTGYTYYASVRGDGYTTTKLETETIDGVTYKYFYDDVGNITEIKSKTASETSYSNLYAYEYDAMSQLVYVSDYTSNTAYSYDYDSDGNITAEYIYEDGVISSPTTTTVNTYSYGDSNWGDKLTAYNGQAITYDQIGNPLTYRDGITMTWQNGRQLTTLSQGDNNISYSYDSNSIRVSKTVNGVKYTYAYVNGLLVYETRGNSRFYYSYDANGTLYSVKYMLESAPNTLITYYYTHNSRGDIVGIYNGDGVQRVKYEYDAWGNVLSITDTDGNAITDPNHIGNLNPFRYRGYYYDSETGFYYLMSRYYDPITHRFINADGYFKSGGNILDINMSAYCRNNPIALIDPSGCCANAWANGYAGPCPGPGQPGCMDYKDNVSHLYSQTTISQDKTENEKIYKVTININTLHFAWPSEQNYNTSQYKQVIEKIAIEIYNQSDGKIELDDSSKAQLYGEMLFHISGYIVWDCIGFGNKNCFLYKKCNKIDLEVSDNSVNDDRWYVNLFSNYYSFTYWLS